MDYDVVIIGGGPGGYTAALRAAALGARVALIEKERVGGVCLHWGCIPTKHLLGICVARGEAEGLTARDGIGPPDMRRIADEKTKIVERLARSLERLLDDGGVERIRGEGSIADENLVHIDGGTRLSSGSIIAATGSRPATLPGSAVRGVEVWTSRDALSAETVPENLLIVGGGAIGCEFAAIYAGLGSSVTVVEAMGEILPSMDAEVGAELRKHFRRAGVTVLTGSKLLSADGGGCVVEAPKGERRVMADALLVAVGRVPVLPDFPKGMIEVEGGGIRVGDDMRTSCPSVFAAGDVTGCYMLAHAAAAQGRVAAANAAGGDERMEYHAVPSCVFTHPEVASVGMSEAEARGRGHSVRTGRAEYRALGIAHASGETAGFAKVVCDGERGTVLGAQIIGARATDLIAELTVAVKLGLTASQLSGVIHAHPTYSEVVAEALEAVALNRLARRRAGSCGKGGG